MTTTRLRTHHVTALALLLVLLGATPLRAQSVELRDVDSLTIGPARIRLVAYDHGAVDAFVATDSAFASVTWWGGELRRWIDAARHGTATARSDRGAIRLTPTGPRADSMYHLVVARAETVTLSVSPRDVDRLLLVLVRADSVMRAMTPDPLLRP